MAAVLSNPAARVQLSANVSTGSLRGVVNHQPAEQNPPIGSSAGGVQKIYNNDHTIDTGTPLSLDLTTILDPAGVAFNPAKVAYILIENLSTTTGQILTVGGGTNGLFAAFPTTYGPNGGVFYHADPAVGITVDGSHKILTVAVAAGTGVPVRVTLWGR